MRRKRQTEKEKRKKKLTRLNGSIGCYQKSSQISLGWDTRLTEQVVIGLGELEIQC